MRQLAARTLFLTGLVTGLLHAQPGTGNRTAAVKSDEPCPAGMTEVRPGNCQAPTAALPSILDYRPRSTLIAPAHKVPTAKFPAIDFHGHPYAQLNSAAGLADLGAALDALNVRIIVVANDDSGESLAKKVALIRATPAMRDRVRPTSMRSLAISVSA